MDVYLFLYIYFFFSYTIYNLLSSEATGYTCILLYIIYNVRTYTRVYTVWQVVVYPRRTFRHCVSEHTINAPGGLSHFFFRIDFFHRHYVSSPRHTGSQLASWRAHRTEPPTDHVIRVRDGPFPLNPLGARAQLILLRDDASPSHVLLRCARLAVSVIRYFHVAGPRMKYYFTRHFGEITTVTRGSTIRYNKTFTVGDPRSRPQTNIRMLHRRCGPFVRFSLLSVLPRTIALRIRYGIIQKSGYIYI